ncbi:DNA repair protein RadC [Burkholderia sp. 3C]
MPSAPQRVTMLAGVTGPAPASPARAALPAATAAASPTTPLAAARLAGKASRSHPRCDDRPRERLLERGPAALTDSELLALLIGNGIAGKHTAITAQALLEHFRSLRALLDASPAAVLARPGIGAARAAVLIATSELVRRALIERSKERTLIDSPEAVHDYLRLTIGTRTREAFLCLYLDAQHRLIDCEESTVGTLTRMAVYPREIVRRALELSAAALIVAHNHPSGAVRPSAEDRRLTRLLREALALVDVRLIDHIVVGASDTLSFSHAGLL